MMPPLETRQESERVFPGISRKLLGLAELNAKDAQTMDAMKEESDNVGFIILSDVFLDDPDTMASLRKLFEGFEDSPPELIVLMGNFSRRPFGLANRSVGSDQVSAAEYTALFDNLITLMQKFPSLLTSQTRWVFVPGPRDPSPSPKEILPRPCLPETIVGRVTSRLPETCRVTFTSNPARIMFYKQEICIFRNDTMMAMRRECIVPTTMSAGTKEASKELISTICNQGHLCPLTLDARPIYCGYERSLQLYPLPDVLILADQYEQYNWHYKGCSVFNPGSFSADGSFVFYRPSAVEVEFSMISRGSRDDNS
jgi:DNA polymerase epsilon subunit 2